MKHFLFINKILILLGLFFFFDFLISLIFLKGLNKYYGFDQNADVLINGSSSSISGFNRTDIEHITQLKIANYSHEGVSIDDRYAMIMHFFQQNPKSVKIVVYEVDPILFSSTLTAENVYTVFYPYMDNTSIKEHIKEKASSKDYYIHKIIRTTRFESRLIRFVMIGYMGKYDNLKSGKLDTINLLPLIAQKGTVPVSMDSSKIEIFEDTMDFIKKNNASIILVMMPLYYAKLQTFDNEGYEQLCNYFETYCFSSENMKFLDLNQDTLIKNAVYFSDLLHFNVYGQREITKIISSYLKNN